MDVPPDSGELVGHSDVRKMIDERFLGWMRIRWTGVAIIVSGEVQ